MLFKLLKASPHIGRDLIVTLLPGGHYETQIKGLGYPVFCLNIKQPLGVLGRLLEIRDILSKSEQIVLCGWMYYGALTALVLKALRPFRRSSTQKIVCNVRHSVADLSREKVKIRIAIQVLKLLQRHIDYFIYNSYQSEVQHARLWGVSSRTSVIPNGFDSEVWGNQQGNSTESISRYPWRTPDAWVFAHVGRVHPMKNHIGLIKAFDRLALSDPNVQLVLVGRGTENLDIHEYKSSARIHALGERHDIPELMSTFDALVLCSSYGEGFPNVVGEAMLSYLPVIVSNVGDSAALTGGFGIIIAPDSGGDLYQAMNELMSWDDEQLRRVRIEGRKHIVENYDMSAIVKQYDELWQDLFQTRLS